MAGILQNAFGNTAYVNQTNLNGKLRKKLGCQTGGQAKIWGAMAHPGPPLESPLSVTPLWPGTYCGYGRPIGHVSSETNNILDMISQQR